MKASRFEALMAIQIIIGLLHIIFAICLCFTVHFSYVHYSEIYSGIIFVASGSVSVSAKKHLNSNLVNCSVGMNIMSAIGALTGIILNVMLLALHSTLLLAGYNHLQQDMYDPAYKSMYFSENLLYGFIITFLLLKLVQFCTVVLVAHFGCRTNCCIDDVAIAYVPCTSTGGHLSPTEDCPAHLTYVLQHCLGPPGITENIVLMVPTNPWHLLCCRIKDALAVLQPKAECVESRSSDAWNSSPQLA
ncbi:Membrane-spanning 4-domains subfamily A member 18 [Varanus komodoensis]|nr:Membrane-spanning 4-domains subfamily A member 18 [Varanus komodoensis]